MKRNAYTCQKCKGTIITVDRDKGTTPFMIECLAKVGCDGDMHSHFYTGPVVNGSLPAAYEWRKPTEKEFAEASVAMKAHFNQGGLDIHASGEYPRHVH